MGVCAGSVVLSIVLCVVGGGVNDDDGVCEDQGEDPHVGDLVIQVQLEMVVTTQVSPWCLGLVITHSWTGCLDCHTTTTLQHHHGHHSPAQLFSFVLQPLDTKLGMHL